MGMLKSYLFVFTFHSICPSQSIVMRKAAWA